MPTRATTVSANYSMKMLITGGCGFIGCNAARYFLTRGYEVTLYDNLSRPLTGLNLEWLRAIGGVELIQGDVQDSPLVEATLRAGRFDVVLHLAGQVAVTTSVADPRLDFESNALGTFVVLEAVRKHSPGSAFLYASTNKVYGTLKGVHHGEEPTRYGFVGHPDGISEAQPLDFHSPYGCSKGCADQYVIDYARIYGLRTVSLRQSCIYGTRQFGVEDQGWLAWFIIAHLLGKEVTIYGTGKQVRDVLYVDDLLRCYEAVIQNIDQVKGQALNIGGGLANSISLVEFLGMLDQVTGRPVRRVHADWRPGDQPVYISDIRKARELIGWEPATGVAQGVSQLHAWVGANLSCFEH